MSRWTYEALERAMAEFSPGGNPADPKERKRLKLIRAATELFVAQGYRKTSVDEVAKRAGVAKGTVYLYFKTKGELLLGAIIEEKKRYLGELKPVFDPAVEPRQRLKTWLRLVLVLGQQMPLVSRLMHGDLELLAALDDIPAAAVAGGRMLGIDFLGELVSEAASPHRFTDRELHDRAQVLASLVYFGGLVSEPKIRGDISVERFAEILATMVVEGIGTEGGVK
jgi:AcrR family transcriptional regulator